MTTEEILYPDADDVHHIHEDIVAGDSGATPGVKTSGAVDSALIYISEGYFGEAPETIHEKAAHLMRLLAAEHPFWDGNKRTALGTTALLYDLNGYDFDYDDEVRAILKAFATDAESVDMDRVVRYCRQHTTEG